MYFIPTRFHIHSDRFFIVYYIFCIHLHASSIQDWHSFWRKEKGYAGFGSTIFAVKPGDGSAREQAASCQKVLGGWANIANEYATKRYRSNLINWGMLPFLIKEGELPFANGDYLFFPQIRKAVEEKDDVIRGYVVGAEGLKEFEVALGELTDDEREIILKGCLINYNRK